MSELKFCKDCEFGILKTTYGLFYPISGYSEWHCIYGLKKVVDKTDGTVWYNKTPRKSEKMRKKDKFCGKDAKWFEPLEEK